VGETSKEPTPGDHDLRKTSQGSQTKYLKREFQNRKGGLTPHLEKKPPGLEKRDKRHGGKDGK